MKYALLFYMNDSEFAARTDPEKKDAFWAGFMSYVKSLKEAGVLAGGTGLEPPSTAKIVRKNGQHPLVHDGPFADTKEHLGGFLIVDVPDLESAVRWAALYPAGPQGFVEVRPALSGSA